MVSDLKLSAINVDVPQRGGTAVSFYDISKNSIFEASENGTPNIEELELMLEEIASEHGIFLNAWNELKEGLKELNAKKVVPAIVEKKTATKAKRTTKSTKLQKMA